MTPQTARILALLTASSAWAQESTTAISNPFNSDADIARGEKTFVSQCASCHGRDGRGANAGPDLTGNLRRATSDESLFQIINKGIPGTTMPGFQLNAGPVWQVVAYIRSLAMNRRNQSGGGDAGRGERLFAEHKCAGCHDGDAPELGTIAARRTLAELRASLLDPQAEVAATWWRIKATTKGGREITGLRLNEDTYTIQYRDPGGALRSLRRADLTRIEFDRTSPMPSFRGKLNDAAMNDLLAYLAAQGAAR